MNEREKIRRRATESMIELLVMAGHPKDSEETVASIRYYAQKPFNELVEAFYSILKQTPLVNTSMIWYTKVCLDEVENLKTSEKQRELVSV